MKKTGTQLPLASLAGPTGHGTEPNSPSAPVKWPDSPNMDGGLHMSLSVTFPKFRPRPGDFLSKPPAAYSRH